MDKESLFSSMPMAEKRKKLRKLADTRVKKKTLNSHDYKKMFQNAKEFGSGSKDKNPRCEPVLTGERAEIEHDSGQICSICMTGGNLILCSGEKCRKSFHTSCLIPSLPDVSTGKWLCDPCKKNITESGSVDPKFKVSTKIVNQVLPYVDTLRDYWKKGQNAVFFDYQDRLLKVVLFVLSLLDNVKKPILVIAAANVVSSWEAEFSKWSKLTNFVTYKGSKEDRATIRSLDFYSQNGSIKFQLLLSTPDFIIEDREMLNHIKWELIVIDQCQWPIISTQIKKLKTLVAHMKLLTVTGESVDYQNILSVLDPKYEEIYTDADVEISTKILEKKLAPFIAFECKNSVPKFKEYWVPVNLSRMQIEKYCSLLEGLSSCLKDNDSLHNILTRTQMCCDHPYLVDPTLRTSSRKDDSVIDKLGSEINVSGKMQLLDRFLLEIERLRLRVVILFQSVVNSEKISTGDILDDLVHRRFGQDFYVRIPEKVLYNSARLKKQQEIETFNDLKNGKFICLLDYRSCHSSIKLSNIDVVILFNSDWSPLNDIKSMQKITFVSHRDPLTVFRLYSSFTVEEKALILSKNDKTNLDLDVYNFNKKICQQLLAWGAYHLFRKLEKSIDWSETGQPFIDNLVRELSILLKNNSSNCSIISNAYCESNLLLGETEEHIKECDLIDEIGPFKFWTNLIKESHQKEKNSGCRLSRRVQKSPQSYCYWFEGRDDYTYSHAPISPTLKTKPRSKRKRRENGEQSNRAGPRAFGGGQWSSEMLPTTGQRAARSPVVSESIGQRAARLPVVSESIGQRAQNEQPMHNSNSTPLGTELEKIQKEKEQVTKLQEEKKTMLISECEREILEIRKKYDALTEESVTNSMNQMKIIEDYYNLVCANNQLAEFLAQKCDDDLDAEIMQNIEKETRTLRIPDISASVLIPPMNPCLTSGPATYIFGHGSGPVSSGIRSAAPHLRSNPSLFAPVYNLPTVPEPSWSAIRPTSYLSGQLSDGSGVPSPAPAPAPAPTPTPAPAPAHLWSTPPTMTGLQTESKVGVYQITEENTPKLPMVPELPKLPTHLEEFYRIIDLGVPLSSNHSTS